MSCPRISVVAVCMGDGQVFKYWGNRCGGQRDAFHFFRFCPENKTLLAANSRILPSSQTTSSIGSTRCAECHTSAARVRHTCDFSHCGVSSKKSASYRAWMDLAKQSLRPALHATQVNTLLFKLFQWDSLWNVQTAPYAKSYYLFWSPRRTLQPNIT